MTETAVDEPSSPREVGGGPSERDDGAADQRAALDELRARVMNVVGHGLRTPMATVRGQAQVLARTDDPEQRDELIAALVASTERLERLLDDVLVAAEVETRLPVGTPDDVPAGPALRRAWERLAPDGASLEVDAPEDHTARVADDALAWILRHVLDNAARYGDGTVRATVGTRGDATELRIGSTPLEPVTEQDLANAFELFYRGHNAVTTAAARLGVGLCVARRIARRAGGDVDLIRDGDDIVTIVRLPR